MYFDAQNLFSNKQVVRSTVVSTNIIKVPRNVGSGEPLYISLHIPTKFSGISKLTVQLQTSDSANGEYVTIQESGEIKVNDLNRKKIVNMGSIPPKTGEYLRLNYVLDGTAKTGTITAGIVLDCQTNGIL